MSVDRFIDTNVLIYHVDDSDGQKHAVATRIIRIALETGNACISYQVVQEFLNAGLRKASVPLDHARAANYLNTVLTPLWRVMPSHQLFQQGSSQGADRRSDELHPSGPTGERRAD